MARPEALDFALHELQVHQAELAGQNRELRESREALEASRARYADLFDFAPIGYMTLDGLGVLLEINLKGAALLGQERESILGKPFRSVVRLDDPETMAAHRCDCIEERRTTDFEAGFVRKADGAHVEVQMISAPMADPTGSTAVCRVAFIDITERKRIEREREEALRRERSARRALSLARAAAEEASRLKDEFLGVVSHELRTPLNAILGWASLLTSTYARDDGKAAKGLEVIRRNAKAQAHLIDDLLDVSRIIRGQLRVDVQRVSLGEVVSAAVEGMSATASAKHVSLTVQAKAGADVWVMGDPERLQQVVWNLLSNAIKFTDPGGAVRVELEDTGAGARIRVVDTGCGMEAEALPWIFERFRQVDSSPRREHGGLGLGLTIVRDIAELHGGRVRAHSAGLGRGSTFEVELPRDAKPQPASGPAPEPCSPASGRAGERLRGIRVLVVEDDEDARDLAAVVLESESAVVETARSAAEGFACVQRATAFDVLVSDLSMPGEDGLTFMGKIRGLGTPASRVAAIAMTAHARPEDATAAIDAGYDEHLPKPVEPEALIQMVARRARAIERGADTP